MSKQKQGKVEQIQLKCHYDQLPEPTRIEVRNSYCEVAKMPIPTFYRKLSTDTFRPLERIAFENIIKEYLGIN